MRRSFALAFLVLAACGDDASRTPDPRATPSAATAGAAPAIVDERPVPRTIELGDGLVVLVTENGQGEALGRGDEALVHYSISYVPVPAPLEAPKEIDAKKDSKDEGAKSSTDGAESKSKAGSTKGSATSDDVDAAAAKTAEAKGDSESGGSKDETAPAAPKSSDAEAPSEALAKDASKPEDSKNAPASEASKAEVVASDAAKAVASGDAIAPKAGDATEPGDATKPDASAKQETTTVESGTKAGETKDAPVDGTSSKDAALATTPVDPSKPLEPVVVATTRDAFAPVALRLDETKAMKGLVRALVGLRVGTRAQVTVPAELAYGKDGLPSAGIPPGVTLSIDVDVRGVRH